MRERGKKKDGQRNVIPPQIFNGQEFRGVSLNTCAHHCPEAKKTGSFVFRGHIMMMMLHVNAKRQNDDLYYLLTYF